MGLALRATSGPSFCEEFRSFHTEKCREAGLAVAFSWTSVIIGELKHFHQNVSYLSYSCPWYSNFLAGQTPGRIKTPSPTPAPRGDPVIRTTDPVEICEALPEDGCFTPSSGTYKERAAEQDSFITLPSHFASLASGRIRANKIPTETDTRAWDESFCLQAARNAPSDKDTGSGHRKHVEMRQNRVRTRIASADVPQGELILLCFGDRQTIYSRPQVSFSIA